MVDYFHHHHFLLLPLHLRNLKWETSFYPSFHHMQKHMALRKLAPLPDTFFEKSQRPRFSQSQWSGHCTQVLHVVKNSDDTPISLLWQQGDNLPHNVRITQLINTNRIELIDDQIQREYISITSSLSFIAKELYSFKTRQCFCSWTLDIAVMELIQFQPNLISSF